MAVPFSARSKLPIIVLVIVTAIVIVTLVPMFHVSDLHSDTDRASLPVSGKNDESGLAEVDELELLPGEFEPIVDPSLMDASENPTLAAAATCRMMDIIHRRQKKPENQYYTPEYAKVSKISGDVKGDFMAIHKRVKRWKDPRAQRQISVSSNTKSETGGVSIFCMVYTDTNGDTASKLVNGWMKDCDDFLVVSRYGTPPQGIDPSKYHEVHVVQDTKSESMFPRLTQTLHAIALKKSSKFDYFVYCTDDSHIVVENLRMALNDPSVDSLHRMGAPLYIGHRMVTPDDVPFVSNAIFIFNTYLLKMMVTILPDTRCFVTHQGGSEDIFMAKCLLNFRIFPLSIEDVFGQERVHVIGIDGVSIGGGGGWYSDYHRDFSIPKGFSAFSVSSFHQHHVNAGDQMIIRNAIV